MVLEVPDVGGKLSLRCLGGGGSTYPPVQWVPGDKVTRATPPFSAMSRVHGVLLPCPLQNYAMELGDTFTFYLHLHASGP
jgi:hypothetical protein